jgi:hypothetical protein
VIKEVRSDPFVFRTIVPEAGFEWLEGPDSEPHLASRAEIESLAWVKEPLALNPGLFVEFANLKGSQDAILKFANQWGDIFDKYGPEDLLPQQGRKALVMGASHDRWKYAIGQMRPLVHVWEAIKNRNLDELEKVITWSDNHHGGVRYVIGHCQSWLIHPADPDNKLRARFTSGDLIWPSKYALQQEINKRLSDSSMMIPPQLVWTHEMNQRILFVPKNLHGAMWIQFAQAVTEEFQLRICAGCGRYFQIGPGGRRPQAKTCKDSCRQRKRRKK